MSIRTPHICTALVLTGTLLAGGAVPRTAHASPAAAAVVARDPSPGAELRTALNTMLQEHVYLASAATNAALGGRKAEFAAAAAALDANSVALSQAIGSVYGNDAGGAFLALWRRHIGFFVDYTMGVAAHDKAKQDAAVQHLLGYADDFAAFLASANPNLPKAVVSDLVKHHVVTLKAVVDAQAAMDPARAYMNAREAAAHMAMIANPLADAIVRQFPEKYGAN